LVLYVLVPDAVLTAVWRCCNSTHGVAQYWDMATSTNPTAVVE
jgi:hypothetical protein